MTLEEFGQKILKALGERLGADIHMNLQNVTKPDGAVHTGIRIGRADEVISPILYLDRAYEECISSGEREELFAEIVGHLLEVYQGAVQGLAEEERTEDYWGFEAWKEQIVYRLVPTRENLIAEDVPRIPFQDLSIVFYGYQKLTQEKCCTFLIGKSCMEQWNVDVSELYRRASVNTPRLFPAKICTLWELLGLPLFQDSPDQTAEPFYIITSESAMYGAAVLLYEGVLRSLAEKLGADLVLIPASVHEWVAIPYEAGMNIGSIREMVCQVNTGQVPAEEQLSDQVYRYSREQDRVEVV